MQPGLSPLAHRHPLSSLISSAHESEPQMTMSGRPGLSTLLAIVANALIPISILIFATGFFPYKPFLPGLAQYETLELGTPPSGPFDKLVFMVVDALRR